MSIQFLPSTLISLDLQCVWNNETGQKTSNRPPRSSTLKLDDNIEMDVRCESDAAGSKESLMVALFNLHPTRVGI
jgi:hypothetical protein